MINKVIKIFTIVTITIIVVLLLAYGVSQSNFNNLKKYDEKDNDLNSVRAQMLTPSKEKIAIAEERFYTTNVKIKKGDMASLGDFTMNISGNRKLTTNISLKFKEKKGINWFGGDSVEDEILDKGVVLRNAVINVISNNENARITNKKMKKEIVNSLNQYLSDGEIEEIYYNNFIIQ
jgi:flagellar FliL protein